MTIPEALVHRLGPADPVRREALRAAHRHGGDPTGSIDLHLGAKAPAGRERNWLATVPGRGFFAIIRLYSPTQSAFDGSWKPTDFEDTSDGAGSRALQ